MNEAMEIATQDMMADEMENNEDDRLHEEATNTDEPIESEGEETALSGFSSSSSNGASHRTSGAGALSVTKALKNGNRTSFGAEVNKNLGYPKSVQLSFTPYEIAIAEELPNNDNYFTVKKHGAKGVIYSASLVKEITERFNLDFSDKVSITFHKVRYVQSGQKTVAIITVHEA
ncbi:hypothetical protein M4D70_25755 [Brevibacillus borstelensis]|uniref:hypothetical protein n=1 Tax=Brevibacillus borstelensis TaxID=45462 RepID=UPI00203FA93E|nr:hypothetical protein [Brevibacillus borstelensis]MCM3625581.1 hypothetical protein [Brevibacillus borstelensis]